jgi:lipopolysaccharide export system permease protein
LNGNVFSSSKSFKTHMQRIDETPSDFKQIEADVTTLNVIQLWRYIKKLNASGINTNEYMIMFLDKFSSSIICVVFALIASIAVFNPNRRTSSFGKNVVFILIFTIVYWFVYTYSLELGKSSKIPPIVACFTVPTLFSFFLVFYFLKNRQLR